MALRERINEDIKAAMKAREAERLGALRLLLAAVKQREVDERITLDDAGVIARGREDDQAAQGLDRAVREGRRARTSPTRRSSRWRILAGLPAAAAFAGRDRRDHRRGGRRHRRRRRRPTWAR